MHDRDIQTSARIIDRYLPCIRGQKKVLSVIDCGAGIGRVAKHLLSPRFDIIDLLDPSEE